MYINNHKSYFPLGTEESEITVFVAVVTLSGIAHPLLSNGDIMKQSSNHTH